MSKTKRQFNSLLGRGLCKIGIHKKQAVRASDPSPLVAMSPDTVLFRCERCGKCEVWGYTLWGAVKYGPWETIDDVPEEWRRAMKNSRPNDQIHPTAPDKPNEKH